jgi:hypothetical protein
MKKKIVKKAPSTTKRIEALESQVAELLSNVQKINATRVVKEPETFVECVVDKDCFYIDPKAGVTKANLEINKGQTLLAGYAVTSTKRAKQLAAIAKMMTVADALNNVPCYTGKIVGSAKSDAWFIRRKSDRDIWVTHGHYGEDHDEMIMFESEGVAKKAIKILGEETIKTAFGL